MYTSAEPNAWSVWSGPRTTEPANYWCRTMVKPSTSPLFKRVGDRWLYRSPNPWVFGDSPHYLINDAQKTQIEAILLPRSPILLAVILVGGIIGWAVAVSTFMWAFSGHENPTPIDLAIMVALIVGPMLAILPVVGLIQRRRVAPFLVGSPLTEERISYAELKQNVQATTPLVQLLNACIASLFASFAATTTILLHLVTRHFVFDSYVALWGFVAITFGVLTVVWYRRVLSKVADMQSRLR